MMHPYIAALDLGRERDHSALAIVEHRVIPLGFYPVYFCRGTETQVWLRTLERFPLGTPYRDVVAAASQRPRTPPYLSRTPLVVDATGVGAAVVEMLPHGWRARQLLGRPHARAQAGRRHRVGRASGAAQVFADRALPLASVLVQEMETFQARPLPSGRVRLQARREADHDDLVMTVALASWYSARQWPQILRQDPLPRTSEPFYL